MEAYNDYADLLRAFVTYVVGLSFSVVSVVSLAKMLVGMVWEALR